MKIPEWLKENHSFLIRNLIDIKKVKDYIIYHDCGKHLCKTIDENGKVHYPNHAKVSANYWKENGGDKTVEILIANDMFFHTCSAKDLDNWGRELGEKVCTTLLLASLAEIHANAEMFGGIESTSFKSKYKQLDRRGKKFCKMLGSEFSGYVYVFVRNDLTDSQKAVQSGHAVSEITKKINWDQSHPSLVYLKVKSENKLKKVIRELSEYGINFSLFRDDIYNNEITAVATEPLYEKDQRDLLKRYSLL